MKAKKQGFVLASNTRAILKMAWSLRICHGIINSLVEPCLTATSKLSEAYVVAGGAKGFSTTDISHAQSLLLERGLDRKSQIGLAQADIKSFFGLIPLGKLLEILCLRVDPYIAVASIRLHLCPQITFCVGKTEIALPQRKRGLTTGTSSAAVLQRVPVEHTMELCEEATRDLAVKFGNTSFCLAGWSDNIFASGRSPESAMQILRIFEATMKQHWSPLHFADDSKIVLDVKGSEPFDPAEFKAFSTMKCLGVHHQDNGGSLEDWENTKKRILAAFFANLEDPFEGYADQGMRSAAARLRLFKNATRGVIGFSSPGWSLSEPLQAKITKLELDLTMKLCPYSKCEQTSWTQWNRVRKLWAEDKIPKGKSWLDLAKQRQLGWYQHAQRHPDKWVFKLLQIDTPTDLERMRRSNYKTLPRWARTPNSGRTETRCVRERVASRWSESFSKLFPEAAAEKPLGLKEPKRQRVQDIFDDGAKRAFFEHVDPSEWSHPFYRLTQPFKDFVEEGRKNMMNLFQGVRSHD